MRILFLIVINDIRRWYLLGRMKLIIKQQKIELENNKTIDTSTFKATWESYNLIYESYKKNLL